MSKYKVDIEIKEVSWSNGKPLKVQAHATVYNSNKMFIKHISGDPCSTEKQAHKSLFRECIIWADAANAVIDNYKEINEKPSQD